MKTGAEYTLALTATPYRGDKLIKIMYWFLGGTIYRETIKINKNVAVKVIHHKSTDKINFHLKRKWYKGQLRPDTGKMITNICKIKSRNRTIINIINNMLHNDPDRKILVLSGRTDHLDILKNGVDKQIKEDIKNGLLDDDEIYTCYYIGKTKQSERQEAEERGDIIFATYDMANEGLDIKHLNTVILASPKKDVIQSIGRIMRTILKSGDVKPLIIDIADDITGIYNWLKNRIEIYKKCRYNIENYYLIDQTFKISSEYLCQEKTIIMHHSNSYIHNSINIHHKLNVEFIEHHNKFEEIDKIIGDGTNCIRIDNTEKYTIIDDVEYTDLDDILYVSKLTEEDIERVIVKNANEMDKLNIEEDMAVDLCETNNMCFDKKQTIRTFTMPTRKLF